MFGRLLFVAALALGLAGAAAGGDDRPMFYPLQPGVDPWAQLKDRHAGERCLYMGNGPSLNRVDFQNHIKPAFNVVMGANKIYLGFDRFNFRPNYFAAANAKVLQQAASEILALPREMVKFLRSDRWDHEEDMNRMNNIVLFNSISTCQEGGAVCKILGESRPGECLRHCDNCFCDASKFVVEGNTITYISLQILFHMGCRDVVLIGVDHSFQQEGKPNSAQLLDGPDPNHFDPRYFGGQHWDLADLESSERHYQIARKHFAEHCGSITDATDAGKLTIYPKARLGDVAVPRTTLVVVLGYFASDDDAWAQTLAMRSWKQIRPHPRVVVLARDAGGAAQAAKLGLEVYSVDNFVELAGSSAAARQEMPLADVVLADSPHVVAFVAHPGVVWSVRDDGFNKLLRAAVSHDVAVTHAPVIPVNQAEKTILAASSITQAPDHCGSATDNTLRLLFASVGSSGSTLLRQTVAGASGVVSAGAVAWEAHHDVDFARMRAGSGDWVVGQFQARNADVHTLTGGVVAIGDPPASRSGFLPHDATCSIALLAAITGAIAFAGVMLQRNKVALMAWAAAKRA